MQDQAVEVVGRIAKGQFCLSEGEADGADEQVESVLLMGERMFDMRTTQGFGCIGPLGGLRHRLAHRFAPINVGRVHLIRQPLPVAPGAIGTVCPDLGAGIVRVGDLPEKTPVRC